MFSKACLVSACMPPSTTDSLPGIFPTTPERIIRSLIFTASENGYPALIVSSLE